MVAGMDRYFQIARCFRDEDLRADRQPEFTQLDLEMSFVTEERVMDFVEAMIVEVSRAVLRERPIQQCRRFPRIDYHEALERYGSDKPDLRFGMELVDLAPALGTRADRLRRLRQRRWRPAAAVKAIVAPGMAEASRHQIDELTEFARRYGAKGLATSRSTAGRRPPIRRRQVPGRGRIAAIARAARSQAGRPDPDRRRRGPRAGRRTSWAGCARSWACAWTWPTPTCWPTAGSSTSRCTSGTSKASAGTPRTIPFSGVLPEDEGLLVTASGDPYKPSRDDPAGRARATQYDVALNGWELGGGSRPDRTAASCWSGASPCRATRWRRCTTCSAACWRRSTSGRLRTAASPWESTAGRPCSSYQTNIREVMAFPKTQSGADLMLEAPSEPEPAQYAELGLRFVGVKTDQAAGP